jgi:recombinational DNA repair ATPase RecF
MNMMYLSPSLRRNFLDNILSNSYEQYSKILKEYKKILNSRNKVLKNISKNKSTKDELNFWDEKFIEKAEIIYEYRFKIIEFLSIHIKKASSYFN